VKYAVWIHVEERDESIGYFRDIVAPICAAVEDSRAEAETIAKNMVIGIPAKHSNRLLEACKNAEVVFHKFGETTGFGLAGPECWAVIEELHKAVTEAEKS
jgi:threonine synthase